MKWPRVYLFPSQMPELKGLSKEARRQKWLEATIARQRHKTWWDTLLDFAVAIGASLSVGAAVYVIVQLSGFDPGRAVRSGIIAVGTGLSVAAWNVARIREELTGDEQGWKRWPAPEPDSRFPRPPVGPS